LAEKAVDIGTIVLILTYHTFCREYGKYAGLFFYLENWSRILISPRIGSNRWAGKPERGKTGLLPYSVYPTRM